MHKGLLQGLLFSVAAASGSFAAPATASAPSQFKVCPDGVCSIVHAVDDQQLAAVAGKFTIAGEVVGMNLTMTSSWQSANGQRLEASAGMSIALPGSGNAHAHFNAAASGTEGAEPGATAMAGDRHVQTGRGLQNVNGVGQVIQVAGDGNGAANHAVVHVTQDPLQAAGGNGRLSAAYSSSNGAQARVAFGDNGVSMQLTMPGIGSARQQINLAGAGNLHQGIQIAADGQQVMNQLQLQLQMQPATRAALTSQGLQHSLNMLRAR